MNYKGIRSKSVLSRPSEKILENGDNFDNNNYDAFNGDDNRLSSMSKFKFFNLNLDNVFQQMPTHKFTKSRDEKTYIGINKGKIALQSGKNSINVSPEKQKYKKENDTPREMSSYARRSQLINKSADTQKSQYEKKSNNTAANINQNGVSLKNNSQQNEMVKVNLKRIFEYYCQFGERMNIHNLKSHKYQKFAIDANLLDSKLTKTRLELIFSTENKLKTKSQMDFDTFLNSLVKIGEYKFLSNHNDIMNKITNKSNSALQMLLKNNIWPLYEKIFGINLFMDGNGERENNNNFIENSNNNSNEKNIGINNNSDIKKFSINDVNEKRVNQEMSNIPTQTNFLNTSKILSSLTMNAINTINVINNLVNIDELILNPELEIILTSISPIMYEIYKVYFPWEISLSENENFLKENSMKAYFKLLKEFDLCPSLIGKSSSFQIFQSETMLVNSFNPFDTSEVNEIYANVLRNIEINPLGRSNNKNILGKYFTFLKFLKTICKIGDLGFEKIEMPKSVLVDISLIYSGIKKLSSIEKICLVLERMEMSEGFLTLEHKTSKTHSKKTSCIIPKEILDKIKFNINAKLTEEENFAMNINPLDDDEKNAELIEQNRRKSKIRKSTIGNFKEDLFEHSNYILEKYGSQLNLIYKFYCNFGDHMNTSQMKTTRFLKFLKEAGLIRQTSSNVNNNNNNVNTSISTQNLNNTFGIKMNDIDIIFIKMAGLTTSINSDISRGTVKFNLDQSQISTISQNNVSKIPFKRSGSIVNSNAKIDFNGFIKAIEIVTLLIFPNRNEYEAIDFIIVNHILPLIGRFGHKNNNALNAIMKEKGESKDFSEVLSVMFKSLTPIFKFYQNKSGFMNFEIFLKFCSDYSIFPDIISKSKLSQYFKTTYDNNYIFTDSGENEFIDQSMFVDIMALCAFDIPYRSPDPDSIEKIILFVEKISQSEGTNKIIKESGQSRLSTGESLDLMNVFKMYYPGFFTKKQEKKIGFFDVLNNDNSNNDFC